MEHLKLFGGKENWTTSNYVLHGLRCRVNKRTL